MELQANEQRQSDVSTSSELPDGGRVNAAKVDVLPSVVSTTTQHDILYGHGHLTGLVAVNATKKGNVTAWYRLGSTIVERKSKFRPWALISCPQIAKRLKGCKIHRLKGSLAFKYHAEVYDWDAFEASAVAAHNDIYKKHQNKFRDIPFIYSLGFTEQFLVASGETFFKGMTFADIKRLSFDIETTGLDHDRDKVFMISIVTSTGVKTVLHGEDERQLLFDFNEAIHRQDPDVMEGHGIFNFDVPFLLARYKHHGLQPTWGRDQSVPWSHEASIKVGASSERFTRYTVRGRQLIDTHHAVKRYDAIKRVLPNHKLKDTAKHFGFDADNREYIPGDQIYQEYQRDPERVVRYGLGDATEASMLSERLIPVNFALVQMVPMTFEKICTAGPTSLIELPMVRAYLRDGHSIPAPLPSKKFEGGLVELCRRGLFKNVIKLDVASMYPSLIVSQKIGPHSDPLKVFQVLTQSWRQMRLEHKAKAKNSAVSSAIEGALKIVINAMFGYLGYERGLFNNPDGAAKVTAEGRSTVHHIKQAILDLGGEPIEIDTDGILCTFPDQQFTPDEFAKAVTKRVAQPGIVVTTESSKTWPAAYIYRAKNYCIYEENGELKKIGAALKSRGMEPIFLDLLDISLRATLTDDVRGVHAAYEATYKKISLGCASAYELCATEKLNQSIDQYRAAKKNKRPAYEALIDAGIDNLGAGDKAEFYKTADGYKHKNQFQSDYDVKHYLDRLHSKFKVLEAAFSAADFSAIQDVTRPWGDDIIVPSSSIVPPVEVKSWINLAVNIKVNKRDPNKLVTRNKFISLDDNESFLAFCKKNKNTDIYVTPWAYYTSKKPTNSRSSSIGSTKMYGDFWIEFEGSKTDKVILTQAALAACEIVAIFERDFGITEAEVRIYFNGGKSLYVRIPVSYFVSEPTLRLCDDYKLVMEYLRARLPEELQARVDHTNYDDSQLLRVPGTVYPGGGVMSIIPLSMLREPDWFSHVADIVESPLGDLDQYFLPAAPEKSTQKARDLFKKIAGATRFKDYRVGRKHQQEKNAIIRSYIGCDGSKVAPCVRQMTAAISEGLSLGFYGRCKFIYESRQAGLSEDAICRLFLLNEDPDRYGAVELDPNPKPDSCGYKLTDKYRRSLVSDCGCDKPDVGPYCNALTCYRASLNLQVKTVIFGDGDPTIQEFQEEARLKLKEFLDD